MSQLVLARGEGYKKSLFKKFFPNFEFGPYFLVSSLIVFVALVTVITLIFSTRQVTKGYMLEKLEVQNQELMKQNEEKEMRISQVRSLNYIQQSSKVQSMRKPGLVVYVGGETEIASR